MKIHFQEVRLKATRRWVENGRKRQETQTFSQTINPFNKKQDGTLKSYEDIISELRAERDEWLAEVSR